MRCSIANLYPKYTRVILITVLVWAGGTLSALASGNSTACHEFYSDPMSEKKSAVSDTFFIPQISIPYMPANARETLQVKLGHLLTLISFKLTAPRNLSIEITQGQSPLGAHAMPIREHLVFDESLFRQAPVFRDAIVGHEAGHVIFQGSMRTFIKEKYPAPEEWIKMAERFTDENYLRQNIKTYEEKFPSLRTLKDSDLSVDGVSHSELALYRTLKMILEKLEHRGEMTDAQQSLDLFILNQMTGFHEVFGDFIGAVFSGDPSWSRSTFNDPASKLLRDFKFDPEKGYGADVAAELSRSIKDGAPHLMLLKMRHAIYKNFYERENETMGKHKDYDVEVAKMVIESLGEVNEKAIVEMQNDPNPKNPGGNSAAAFLTIASSHFERAIQRAKDKNVNYYIARQRERAFFESLRPRVQQNTSTQYQQTDQNERVIVRPNSQHDRYRSSGE